MWQLFLPSHLNQNCVRRSQCKNICVSRVLPGSITFVILQFLPSYIIYVPEFHDQWVAINMWILWSSTKASILGPLNNHTGGGLPIPHSVPLSVEGNVISPTTDAACGYHLGWRNEDPEWICPESTLTLDFQWLLLHAISNSFYIWGFYVQAHKWSKKTVLYLSLLVCFDSFGVKQKLQAIYCLFAPLWELV